MSGTQPALKDLIAYRGDRPASVRTKQNLLIGLRHWTLETGVVCRDLQEHPHSGVSGGP